MKYKGILAAGNWIVDHVKIIDRWPDQNMLVNITDQVVSVGGGPHNVLVDIARMDNRIPLFAAGLIGDDSDGDFILSQLHKSGINTDHLKKEKNAHTSYTDVMIVKEGGNRTFFHFRGANASLDIQHLEHIEKPVRLFYLGYLLLLDRIDSKDEEYGVVAARLLSIMKNKGYETVVDVVSEDSDRFSRVVTPCLKYIDYLILNEIEAGRVTGFNIRKRGKINKDSLEKAADALLAGGIGKQVIIHFPEGGYACTSDGKSLFIPSYKIEPSEIVGSVGAGDAFCAGCLYAIHENLDLEDTLKLANASAYFNLKSPTTTGGAVPIERLLEFMAEAPANRKIS